MRPHEVARNHHDRGDDESLDILTRFIIRMRRKPDDWVPGGWYDPEAPESNECFMAYGKRVHNCERICRCHCHAQKLRAVEALFQAERNIEAAKRLTARVRRIDNAPTVDPDLVHFGIDLAHLYEPFPDGR